jgi:hypothetical protein
MRRLRQRPDPAALRPVRAAKAARAALSLPAPSRPAHKVASRWRGTRARRCGSRAPASLSSVQRMPKRAWQPFIGAAGQHDAIGQPLAHHIVDEGRRQLADAGKLHHARVRARQLVKRHAMGASEHHDPPSPDSPAAAASTLRRTSAMLRSGRSMPGTRADMRRNGVAVGQAPAQMPHATHMEASTLGCCSNAGRRCAAPW